MAQKDLIPYKKGHKKIAGRKKGIPNKITRDIKNIFERLIGFITDKDLYEIYKKFKKRPELFLKFLQIISPKDIHILLKGSIKTEKIDLNRLTENELIEYLKLTEKIENDNI